MAPQTTPIGLEGEARQAEWPHAVQRAMLEWQMDPLFLRMTPIPPAVFVMEVLAAMPLVLLPEGIVPLPNIPTEVTINSVPPDLTATIRRFSLKQKFRELPNKLLALLKAVNR